MRTPPPANRVTPPISAAVASWGLLFLGYWGRTCTHAYALTPAAARRMLRHNRLVCDPRWAVDQPMHQHACRGRFGGEMRCAYALPNVPNGPDTRFDGIIKQRRSMLDRASWVQPGFR